MRYKHNTEQASLSYYTKQDCQRNVYFLKIIFVLPQSQKEWHCQTIMEKYAEYIMRNARLDETQAGIKVAGRNINNLR